MRYIQSSVMLLLLTLSSALFSQEMRMSIDSITSNPGKYLDNAIEVEGLVTQYVPATSSSTSYFLMKSDYGAIIKVNTSDVAPETNKKYRVGGIVYFDPITKEPFISEKSRMALEAPTPSKQLTTETPVQPPASNQTLIYILIIAIVVLAGVFFYLTAYRRKQKSESVLEVQPLSNVASSSPSDSLAHQEFKTIKYSVQSPKTVKFIPGKLVITSGEDAGKSFRIAGYPTPDGSVVTIGREEASGDRAYAHIQLDKKFTTVSRKQAEIIERNGKLNVKNVSETNITVVDGRELRSQELAELKPDSTMRMGELEFQYKL